MPGRLSVPAKCLLLPEVCPADPLGWVLVNDMRKSGFQSREVGQTFLWFKHAAECTLGVVIPLNKCGDLCNLSSFPF